MHTFFHVRQVIEAARVGYGRFVRFAFHHFYRRFDAVLHQILVRRTAADRLEFSVQRGTRHERPGAQVIDRNTLLVVFMNVRKSRQYRLIRHSLLALHLQGQKVRHPIYRFQRRYAEQSSGYRFLDRIRRDRR